MPKKGQNVKNGPFLNAFLLPGGGGFVHSHPGQILLPGQSGIFHRHPGDAGTGSQFGGSKFHICPDPPFCRTNSKSTQNRLKMGQCHFGQGPFSCAAWRVVGKPATTTREWTHFSRVRGQNTPILGYFWRFLVLHLSTQILVLQNYPHPKNHHHPGVVHHHPGFLTPFWANFGQKWPILVLQNSVFCPKMTQKWPFLTICPPPPGSKFRSGLSPGENFSSAKHRFLPKIGHFWPLFGHFPWVVVNWPRATPGWRWTRSPTFLSELAPWVTVAFLTKNRPCQSSPKTLIFNTQK